MTIGRPFVKGQSGNPSGRPKSRPFKEAIDRAIKAAASDEVPITLDDIARALLVKAKTGDVSAIKEIAERYDGKVAQTLKGDDEEPIRHILEVSWKSPGEESK